MIISDKSANTVIPTEVEGAKNIRLPKDPSTLLGMTIR